MQDREIKPPVTADKVVSNGTLTLYTSIKQLPITRYNQLNNFYAQQLGMGSDMDSVSKHYSKLDTFLATKDIEKAMIERVNLHYNLFMVLEQTDINSRSFLCFVHSINGQVVGDLDDDDEAEAALKMLYDTGCTVGDVEDIFDELKKKLIKS